MIENLCQIKGFVDLALKRVGGSNGSLWNIESQEHRIDTEMTDLVPFG